MIQTRDLSYSIGSFRLQVSLSVEDAEYFVLLGMTGSGKTILLENLCGLRKPAAGAIWIDRQDKTLAEPRQRNIGYVPQDGALFEHLNVAGNIGFALRLKGAARNEREEEVRRIASLIGIEHLLQRRIRGLSGGERQRVALARALASQSSVLLLDEPVSALDEHTRASVCRELKLIQRTLKLSVVHVCHSFEEARMIGDRIGIMHQGNILQADTADGLMHNPASEWVANILRLENLFTGEAAAEGGRGLIRCKGLDLLAPQARGPVRFMIRSWQISLAREGRQDGAVNTVRGKVEELDCAGPIARLKIGGALPLCFHLSRHELQAAGLREGSEAALSFPPEAIHIFKEQ